MIKVVFDDKKFNNEMKNIVKYSIGFLDGVEKGKTQFLHSLGVETIELLKQYIDSNARVNPELLHHVYEWHRTGSPEARLFDIDYTVSNIGLSFKSTFRQSTSVKNGSTTPFYDKARIMEQGIAVTITPKRANVLAFEDNGDMVFTKGPVEVDNPGGDFVQGSFEKTFDTFFAKYFTQAFLSKSGIRGYLESPVAYKKNLMAGKKVGRSKGIETGYRWIANAVVVR